ncbi:DUF4435 domain-containing protein [Bacillus altitudinis]|uniref:DUF4435 domain-containing protein n=1 Tax=Bacillus altitudinis TaxID=293387 RepID=UPI0011A57ADE|nr:DUF4435 domain-containing protein [Bacillus altitudinis]QII23238.1 DUF4435 domain-containing protein [Bacillus altitudinis]
MPVTKEMMKEALFDKSAIWMEFSKNSRQHPNLSHCFFEGEDRKYYFERIELYSQSHKKIGYDCKGKDNVISIWNKISKNPSFGNFNLSFFIDKDYEKRENYSFDKKVYITPSHSIENLYVNINSFQKLIEREFGLNVTDDDFKKVSTDFKNRYSEFQELIAPLNAFIISCNKSNLKINYNEFRINDFLEIKIDKISVLNEINFETLKDYYSEKMDKNIKNKKKNAFENQEVFNQYIDIVDNYFLKDLNDVINNKQSLIHGKMELYFLKEIIESLKQYNKNKKYFSTTRSGVYIDIQSKNILSNLSQYAYTPECLIKFIKHQFTKQALLML